MDRTLRTNRATVWNKCEKGKPSPHYYSVSLAPSIVLPVAVLLAPPVGIVPPIPSLLDLVKVAPERPPNGH